MVARASLDCMDSADWDRPTELVASLRRERDWRRATGADTAWIDQMLGELEALTADLDAAQAIRAVIARHGPARIPPTSWPLSPTWTPTKLAAP